MSGRQSAWRTMDKIHNTVLKVVTKSIPKRKRCKKAKYLSEEVLQVAEKRREAKGKEEKKQCAKLNVELQRRERRDDSLIEWTMQRNRNNRMGWWDLFKKFGDIKGISNAKLGTMKNRNKKDLTKAEKTKKNGKNTQKTHREKV